MVLLAVACWLRPSTIICWFFLAARVFRRGEKLDIILLDHRPVHMAILCQSWCNFRRQLTLFHEALANECLDLLCAFLTLFLSLQPSTLLCLIDHLSLFRNQSCYVLRVWNFGLLRKSARLNKTVTKHASAGRHRYCMRQSRVNVADKSIGSMPFQSGILDILERRWRHMSKVSCLLSDDLIFCRMWRVQHSVCLVKLS